MSWFGSVTANLMVSIRVAVEQVIEVDLPGDLGFVDHIA
jgi:hypothetical protein